MKKSNLILVLIAILISNCTKEMINETEDIQSLKDFLISEGVFDNEGNQTAKGKTVYISSELNTEDIDYIPDSITLYFLEGGALDINEGQTVVIESNIISGNRQIFNIPTDTSNLAKVILQNCEVVLEWFGADGDESSINDTYAFIHAINSQAKKITINASYYIGPVNLNLVDNTIIEGVKGELKIRNNEIFNGTYNNNFVKKTSYPSDWANWLRLNGDDVTVSNLNFNANGVGNSEEGYSYYWLRLKGNNNIIQYCYFSNGGGRGDVINVNGNNNLINFNTLNNCGNTSTETELNDPGLCGITVYGSENIISNNKIYSQAWGDGIHIVSGSKICNISDNIINGTIARRSTAGIAIDSSSENIIISDNIVKGCEVGIATVSSEFITITGNLISNTWIFDNLNISSDQPHLNGSGIYLEYNNCIVVSSNMVKYTEGAWLYNYSNSNIVINSGFGD